MVEIQLPIPLEWLLVGIGGVALIGAIGYYMWEKETWQAKIEELRKKLGITKEELARLKTKEEIERLLSRL